MSDFRRSKSNDLGQVGFVGGDFDNNGMLLEDNSKDNDKPAHNSLRRGRVSRSAGTKGCGTMASADDFIVNDTSKVMLDAISTKLNNGSFRYKQPSMAKKSTTVHDAVDDVPYQTPSTCTASRSHEKHNSCLGNEVDGKSCRNERKFERDGGSCPRTSEKKACKNISEGNVSKDKKCACSSFISKVMAFFGFSSDKKKTCCNPSKAPEKKHNNRGKGRSPGNRKGNRANSDFKTKEEG
ncbi:MAG: hypothetical protein LBI37_02645 [Puniceicoccales bacterium]|nr:hypothetical protein [Puniceicoccales bacterium]